VHRASRARRCNCSYKNSGQTALENLQIPLGHSERLLHRLEGPGWQNDKQRFIFDQFFEIALVDEATVENQCIFLDAKRSDPAEGVLQGDHIHDAPFTLMDVNDECVTGRRYLSVEEE
jgi:hypothetical protein